MPASQRLSVFNALVPPSSTRIGAPNSAPNWLHGYLSREMALSKRRGSWFRLEKRERSMFSLALRLKATFKGLELLRAMVGILKKLMAADDATYGRLVRGLQLAWAFSSKGVEWGNGGAKEWRNDLEYAKYLGSHMSSEGRIR